MKFKYFITLILILLVSNIRAQSTSKEVLFTVDGAPIYTSEFLRVYNKNLDLVQDESQKDIEKYLKLFINYKLKLNEAKALGLNEKPSYQQELLKYKKQLASSFMKDTKVTDALVEEAYNRISYDVNANHILVKLADTASPQDTLTAYNNIIKLRGKALKEGFEKVMKEVHNGETIYGEALGYFSGFRMVYKFENVAFNTAVNEISKPFRTRFGYHIVHVLDKRKSRGERTVAHIMLLNKESDSLAEKPEIKIQELYKKLTQGDDFESLAKQFSEDKNSAPRGGMLSPFSGGQLGVQEFEDVAFELESIGDISKPFKTNYGWHIVKLYDKKPIPEFEAIKPELIEKVKRDDRSKLIDDALVNKLKTHYNIKDEQPALPYFESILNDDYFVGTWQLPTNFVEEKPLIVIGKKQFIYKDFGDYLQKKQRKLSTRSDYKSVILNKYKSFLAESLIGYHEDNLEQENQDFAYVLEEYRDGLLLFELMENTIWNVVKTDLIAIQEYYNNHKNNYVSPQSIDAIVASSANEKTLKKVSKLLEQNMDLNQIKSLVNSNDKIDVVFTQGILEKNHQSIPKDFQFKKGISKIYKHNHNFVLVQVKEILPEALKTFEEAKGAIMSDYQTFKEENWLKELSKKYPVVINQEVLNNIKKQIKNQ